MISSGRTDESLAGIDTLECISKLPIPEVMPENLMPGKATVPITYYFEAFAAAVKEMFTWTSEGTYLLAGLGDS
jgi:hypothetical protein